MFWQWDADESGKYGPYNVQTSDATYIELVRPAAGKLRAMAGGQVAQCSPGSSRSFQVVDNPVGGGAPFFTGGCQGSCTGCLLLAWQVAILTACQLTPSRTSLAMVTR